MGVLRTMSPLSHVLRVCFAAAVALGAVAPLAGQLTAWSPFRFGPGVETAVEAPPALEFDGYLSGPRGLVFVVHDKTRKTRAWLTLHQRNADLDVIVKKHDAVGETLTIEHQGRTQVLPLRRARIAPAGPRAMTTASPSSAAVRPPAVPLAPTRTPPAGATSLQQIAAEIEARKLARERAAAQSRAANAPVSTPAAQTSSPAQRR